MPRIETDLIYRFVALVSFRTLIIKRLRSMPTFHIELFEGRTVEQKRTFVEAITRVTCETLGCEPASVDIVMTDVKRENWATGGKLWSDVESD
jgi:4-oxalocrotonate tautomerase